MIKKYGRWLNILCFYLFICLARLYIIYWVALPEYRDNLSGVLSERWFDYVMNIPNLFLFELFFWPCSFFMILVIGFIRERKLLREIERLGTNK